MGHMCTLHHIQGGTGGGLLLFSTSSLLHDVPPEWLLTCHRRRTLRYCGESGAVGGGGAFSDEGPGGDVEASRRAGAAEDEASASAVGASTSMGSVAVVHRTSVMALGCGGPAMNDAKKRWSDGTPCITV